MSVFQDVEKQFAERAVVRHGIMLLRPADAVECVKRCAEHGIEVLGIDGFLVDDEIIQPLMEHSVDLTLRPAGAQQYHHQEATDFLKSRLGSEFWFEVIAETS